MCRVCGKEYEPCRTARKNPNVFHWQEVACSPECGAVYLELINESRERKVERHEKAAHKKHATKKSSTGSVKDDATYEEPQDWINSEKELSETKNPDDQSSVWFAESYE